MSSVKTETVEVKVADGSKMSCFVARAEGKRLPGVIVFQEAFGVNSHIKDVTQRLAAQGYVAIAPELFHRTAPPGFVGDYNNFQAIGPHFQGVTHAALEADIRASYNWLTNDSQVDPARTGAVGFCMGGRAAFQANATVPLKAAVSYYGGRIVPDYLPLAEKQHGPILLVWGGLDKHIGVEQERAVSDALRKANKIFAEIEFSDADHGFLCNERASFQPKAAEQAWALTLAFFKSHI